jgi:hypothetical protein
MNNLLHDDFKDFIYCLNFFQVKYLLVGGYAVIVHGHARNTGDMDIWVKRDEENYRKLQLAFYKFHMPVFDMTMENFLNHQNWDVFRFGRQPVAIDIMVKMGGLDFDSCYEKAEEYDDGDLKIKIISLENLKKAKQQAGRLKDLDDLKHL